jgi:probable rRNA maturation factor
MTLKNEKLELSRIQVRSRQRCVKINNDSVVLFCAAMLQSLGLQGRALSVAFISSRMMKTLNTRYRNKNCATDVLSFSYDEEIIEGALFLGEIIIAAEVAANQAMHYGVCPEVEIRKLLLHGTLHLMGYDHETDAGQMNRMQHRLIRRRFFMKDPMLIALKENQ